MRGSPGSNAPQPPMGEPSLSTRILTPRLALRPPRTADVPELRRALRHNAAHLLPWSVAPVPGEDATSLTSVSRAVLRHRKEWKTGQAYVLVITRREEDRTIIGRVALGGVLRGAFQNAYLGYWIDEGHQGDGLMTEAVRAATAFALGTVGLHRVQAAVMPRNAASQRVLDKVGYRREGLAERYLCIAGEWEDHIIFAMTVEEWTAREGASAELP
ncbi:MAG TPA: GNAT family protein [Polyangiaceae bacterium]|nr:GNAT family protein [Polyangiaceae bacterium]